MRGLEYAAVEREKTHVEYRKQKVLNDVVQDFLLYFFLLLCYDTLVKVYDFGGLCFGT